MSVRQGMNVHRLMCLSFSEDLGVHRNRSVHTGLFGETYVSEAYEERVMSGSNVRYACIPNPPCCMHGMKIFSSIGRL